MSKYICMSCGFMGDFDDFSYGDCPACGSQDCGVVVTKDQLYKAIGAEGKNVRLAW